MLHFCKDFGEYSSFLPNVPFSAKLPLSKGTLCYLQGRSQDFFRGTHNSPNRFAPHPQLPQPPPPITTTTTTTTNKSFLDKKFVYVVSLTVFFCLWITLSGVWLMHLTYLSHNKATCFSGFVTLFCYWLRFVVFKQMQHVNPHWKGANLVKSQWILKPKFKVIPMPCKFQKFAMFCSVNNLSNLSGYFFAFDHTIL